MPAVPRRLDDLLDELPRPVWVAEEPETRGRVRARDAGRPERVRDGQLAVELRFVQREGTLDVVDSGREAALETLLGDVDGRDLRRKTASASAGPVSRSPAPTLES